MDIEDPVNQEIICLLSSNGRASNKSIAKKMGVSETTIANRIRSLYEENVIRVVLQHDSNETSPASVTAIVEFYLKKHDKIEVIAKAIASIDEVFSVYMTTRPPDLIAQARAKSARELNSTILKMASEVPYLHQINTLPILSLGQYSTTCVKLGPPIKHNKQPENLCQALIALLQQDGRQSVSALAKQLGLSITATRYRLNNLLKQPGYKIVLVTDADAMGFTSWFDIRATIQPAHIANALKKFSGHKNIRLVAHLSGPANLALFVLAKSVQEVDDIVCNEIRPLPGLIDFTLMRVPRVFKHEYNYNL